MCVGDWRLGRLIRNSGRSVAIAPAGTITLNADKNRVGLSVIIEAPSNAISAGVLISTGGVAFTWIGTNQNNNIVTIASHGDIVTKALTLLSVGLTVNISITEYFMPEAYLAAALQEFESKYGLSMQR